MQAKEAKLLLEKSLHPWLTCLLLMYLEVVLGIPNNVTLLKLLERILWLLISKLSLLSILQITHLHRLHTFYGYSWGLTQYFLAISILVTRRLEILGCHTLEVPPL